MMASALGSASGPELAVSETATAGWAIRTVRRHGRAMDVDVELLLHPEHLETPEYFGDIADAVVAEIERLFGEADTTRHTVSVGCLEPRGSPVPPARLSRWLADGDRHGDARRPHGQGTQPADRALRRAIDRRSSCWRRPTIRTRAKLGEAVGAHQQRRRRWRGRTPWLRAQLAPRLHAR